MPPKKDEKERNENHYFQLNTSGLAFHAGFIFVRLALGPHFDILCHKTSGIFAGTEWTFGSCNRGDVIFHSRFGVFLEKQGLLDFRAPLSAQLRKPKESFFVRENEL